MEVSRRQILGAGGLALGAATLGGVGTALATEDGAHPSSLAERFYGTHQSGITTPAQDRLHFAALDLTTTSKAELVALLKAWSVAAAAMTGGRDVGAGISPTLVDAPPDDTGEAYGLPASRLTITIGFGPSLFDGRFGLADHRPAALATLPAFRGDALEPARSDGDLCIQACADDPQVAVHAVRNLARLAHSVAGVRWSQLGFGRTSSTTSAQVTARNLMGFKDGTRNILSEERSALAEHVWVARGDDAKGDWLTGGSYLVARRIRMHIETWDRTGLSEQERIIGRDKLVGAPLGQQTEHETPNLQSAAIDDHAHIRLAAPSSNGGVRLLRRGYSFVDGSDGLGRLDAGLFFLAYQRDPRTGFIPVQTSLAGKDRDPLNEYIVHTSSALFAIPPGLSAAGDYYGRSLLEA